MHGSPLVRHPEQRPVAVLWTYDPDAPSTRHRLRPVLRALAHGGWTVRIDRLPKGRYFRRIAERRRDLDEASLLILGKVSLGLGEGWLLRSLTRRILFDVDDAIHLARPRRRDHSPGYGVIRRAKFRHTCQTADRVVVGNETLAAATDLERHRLRVLPTSVAIPSRRELSGFRRQPRTLVWIGRPENLCYLEALRPVLAELSRVMPDLVLRVVCSKFPDWHDVRIEKIPWSSETEIQALAESSIGLMPLFDDAWTRGKCGFKLLQYMSVGLPTVASPIGVNQDIVDHGGCGYLASDAREWLSSLRRLLDHPEHAMMLGRAGRVRVAQRFDRSRHVSRYLDVISELLTQGHEPVIEHRHQPAWEGPAAPLAHPG